MKRLEIPERFTGKIYFYVDVDPTSSLYGELFITDFDPSDWRNKIVVGSADIDIPLDAQGSTGKQIKMLRDAKQRIIKDATTKAEQLQEAIESLLAIEHKESADETA